MMTARGVPTIYYGDEQGFVGDGNDQDAREDMFASKVAVYNDNDLIGTDSTTAQANFDTSRPLYKLIRELSDIRKAHPALRSGTTIFRGGTEGAGLAGVLPSSGRPRSSCRAQHVGPADRAERHRRNVIDALYDPGRELSLDRHGAGDCAASLFLLLAMRSAMSATEALLRPATHAS